MRRYPVVMSHHVEHSHKENAHNYTQTTQTTTDVTTANQKAATIPLCLNVIMELYKTLNNC